jgi:putative membrane protein
MHMKFSAIAALAVGVAITGIVLWHIGLGPVLAAVERVGWGGFGLIVLAGLMVSVFSGLGWYALAGEQMGWPKFIAVRQLRDSASDLLPFTQFGGILIGARAAILGGLAPPLAFASTVVDVTTELMAQIAFVVLGLLLGITQLRANAAMAPYADGMIVGTALLIPGVILFVVLQRRSGAITTKLASRFLPAAISHTQVFTEQLSALYAKPWKLTASSVMHFAAWLTSGLWLWLVMHLCGAHIDVLSAMAIESLLTALRSATVFIPSAIGVQEAGYAALAPVFGVGAEIGLAVSLLKRGRDVVVGVPMLMIWQALEGKRAFSREPR